MIRKPQLPEVEPVVLKNLGSMRPGVYILIALIALILAAFFVVFFLHGLTTNKSYITFNTNLKGVAIYEDGAYLGSTDGSVYRTTSGEHVYTFTYNTTNGKATARFQICACSTVTFSLFRLISYSIAISLLIFIQLLTIR